MMSMYSYSYTCLLALNGQLLLRASAGHRCFNTSRFFLEMFLLHTSIAKLITMSVPSRHFVPWPENISTCELCPFWYLCRKGAGPLLRCHSLRMWATLLPLQRQIFFFLNTLLHWTADHFLKATVVFFCSVGVFFSQWREVFLISLLAKQHLSVAMKSILCFLCGRECRWMIECWAQWGLEHSWVLIKCTHSNDYK